jgi:predicted GH43/DUF377 family glycosyl hydrolase
MRSYCIGAILLDLDDPRRVIGRLSDPLLVANEEEREGYAPNVVYSCGALVHGQTLVVPYGFRTAPSALLVSISVGCWTGWSPLTPRP